MAVGNGEFAFNFDVTGLQSFPEYYEKTMPIGILSNWGWHSFPNPEGYSLDRFKMAVIKKHDREFVYPAASTSNPPPDAAYLRGNPHRFGLGRIGLEMTHADGSQVAIRDLQHLDQRLDLWGGIVTSSFEVDGTPVHVTTAVHPERDEVATVVESPLIASGPIETTHCLSVRAEFVRARLSRLESSRCASNGAHPTWQETPRISRGRSMQLDTMLRTKWSDGALLTETGKHQYRDRHASRTASNSLRGFRRGQSKDEADSARRCATASRRHWQQYWTSGGVIDLSGNDDPRAAELERRIVLSQYLMAVHDAGSLPPQETGLAVNSWFGKFHMEMYWWHAAHWALWGHPEILEKSLDHLTQMMPPGRAMAQREGCKGVKWSKMTDPDGVESPSGIGPVLVWQQPHPIYLAELVWRAHHDRASLERYKQIVFETADYMATFVDFDAERKQYVLGPGVASAEEKHTDYAHNLNPTMELGYWKWALETAQEWRVRMGMPKDDKWQDVIDHLAPLTIRDGVYPTLEFPVETRAAPMATWLFGILPGRGIDRDAMRNTLHAVPPSDGNQTWGTAMVAMCAARMNEPERAIDLLVGNFEKNSFRPSGYTIRRPTQTPMYMPANGGWLAAVAMMAAGWDGNTAHAPGFPPSWKVRYEGLQPMP